MPYSKIYADVTTDPWRRTESDEVLEIMWRRLREFNRKSIEMIGEHRDPGLYNVK